VSAALRQVLDLVVSGQAASRADVARRSGLARSTVSHQIDFLLRRHLIEELETGESVRGRPPRVLSISPGAASMSITTIVVIDIDAAVTQLAIADLTRTIVARDVIDITVDRGPDVLLPAITERIRMLLADHGRSAERVQHVVAGLPAPVDFQHGCPVRPPIMPGWDGYPVGAYLREQFGVPVTVDNDVNLMALGEASRDMTSTPLLFIKVAAGIGAGIITADGDVHRGADGAAGDIGHIRAATQRGVVCRCGKLDCLEAVASYQAVIGDLDIPGAEVKDPLHRVRQAATDIGEVVAMLIHTLNPRTLVLAGPLIELHDEILSGVRAVVYERALPLATRKLTITTTELGSDAGLVGAVALAAREIFSPAGVIRLLADR
jgi:predicted NBD/HSP70 family sugar kinase